MKGMRLLGWLLVAGCGPAGGEPADAGPSPDGGPPVLEPLALVRIDVGAGAGEVYGASLTAAFREGPVPSARVLLDSAGDCQLTRAGNGSCDPPCTTGVCLEDGRCLPYPAGSSAGTLTWTLPGGPRSVAYDDSTQGYYDSIAGPVVTLGGTTRVMGQGFDLSATVPEPLDLGEPPPPLTPGQDVTFTWPAQTGTRIRVFLPTDTASHGLESPMRIECDVADTGQVVVAWRLIEPWLDPANWGCGDCRSAYLERYRDVVGGGVTLRIALQRAFGVEAWRGR
jgi:hypothetical protein